jgi:cytochrome c-type biogenesis protein
MSEYLQAFVLGNAAILTNVCILPLYPGLIAFLAGNAQNERAQKAAQWMGFLVLLGVLTLMLLVGLALFVLQRSFDALLPILLPVIYGIVIVMGILMLIGRNPFNRLSSSQVPVLRNPFTAAYAYGLLLGPITLPCAGPLVVSAFLLAAGSAAGLLDGILYFFFFGLGFGWPLVLLPFAALSLQKRFTGWMTSNYVLLMRISGLLLIGIGVLGFAVDLAPNI